MPVYRRKLVKLMEFLPFLCAMCHRDLSRSPPSHNSNYSRGIGRSFAPLSHPGLPADGAWRNNQEHPWFLEATTTRQSLMGPNELSWMEAALAMLAESGLRPKERHHAFLAIIGHVRGHATFQQIRASSGVGEEWTRELANLLHPEANRYPILLDVLRSGAFSESISSAFDFGLDCILEGIRERVRRRRR
jgi:Tetracyclin repressor-like, C-terminal domain